MADRGSLDPLPYYKWHWLRWRASRKVQRMGILERGIYRELLDEQWAEGCIREDLLPDILDNTKQVLALAKQVLSKCFVQISLGIWQNETLEEQRTEIDKIRSNRKVAGALGGSVKKNTEASAKQTEASAKQVPYRERERREKNLVADATDPRFSLFVARMDRYWKQQPGHETLPLPMDQVAGKKLKEWLKSNPHVEESTWWQYLKNMHISENVNPAWNVRDIVARIHLYADGPLDAFGKPMEAVCE